MTNSNDNIDTETDGLSRRHFMRLAVLGSTALFVPCDLLESGVLEAQDLPASAHGPAPAAFAAFRPLPPGAVRADGWLAQWLGKQANGLGYYLPEISWPFTDPYWQGKEEIAVGDGWWPWEQKAYWVDGATRLALVTGDERLLRAVNGPIDYTLSHARPEGYYGPDAFRSPGGDFHRWPHSVFTRGLSATADATSTDAARNQAIVEAIRKHYLSDDASYSKPIRNITNVEDMLWCYERTGDPRLLALAEKSWKDYAKLNGVSDGADLDAEAVFADTPIDAHGVTYAETSKQPAILYMHTGKPEYLKFALAAQQRIFDHHMLIDGIPCTSEHYGTRTALDSHETCDISDHTWSWGYLLMASGDGAWGDRVERACFNAGLGAIKKDWKGLQYFSCPNQFIATQTSDHNAMNPGRQMMAYQPNPGHATACCGGDVHRLFPNYVIRMWMKDRNGGVAATLYGPCTVNTTVGHDAHPVEIEEKTDYPFGEEIHFTIRSAKPVEFPFSLRIPGWCASPSLLVNGKVFPMPTVREGFVSLKRKFHPGDTVTLVLPMRAAVSHWPDNGIGVEHGPLVYSLPIRENWTAVVEPKWSTADFPTWDARPASTWNYGLSLDPAKIETDLKVRRTSMTGDPWTNPPVIIGVPAKQIADWKLYAPKGKPEHPRTPPLPSAESRQTVRQTEEIVLVPYGSTHLRVTVFPDLFASKPAAS